MVSAMMARVLLAIVLTGGVAASGATDDAAPRQTCGIAAWTGTCACAPTLASAPLPLRDYMARLARSGDMAAVARSERECRVRRVADRSD